MAVFTQVLIQDLLSTMTRFGLGEILRLEGISAGIENTNYFLDTKSANNGVDRWVLTVFENMETAELPYFVELTRHIQSSGLAVPAPLVDQKGEALIKLHGKDAMIVPCLSGRDKVDMSVADCQAIGEWLAKMHVALKDFKPRRALVRDLNWMRSNFEKLANSQIAESDLELLEHSIQRYEVYRDELRKCPQGTVHGDLFKDNALFSDNGIGQEVSGVIDFYHACNASLIFDLAVCANDWTHHGEQGYSQEKLDAMLSAYQKVRPWTEQEKACWPLSLEVAALRFWISRLASKYLGGYQQESVAGDTIKDPDAMREIIIQLRA